MTAEGRRGQEVLERHDCQKLELVQALRAVAASAIVAFHSHHEFGLGAPSYPLQLGVDVFFVISGFVMVYTSRNQFGDRKAWKTFARRRLVRIAPLYWFYTMLLALVAALNRGVLNTAQLRPAHLLLSCLFIPHQSPGGPVQPFLGVGWTLNYEVYFYAVFAVFLCLSLPRMILGLALFFATAVFAGVFVPPELSALYFWTRPVVLEFLGGAFIGYLFLTGRRLPRQAFVLAPILAASLASLSHFAPAARGPTAWVICVLLVAAVILPKGLEHRAIPRWLFALGEASYSIYLSHLFVLRAISSFAGAMPSLPSSMLCVVGTLASLLLGYVLYSTVERRLLSWVRLLVALPTAHDRRAA